MGRILINMECENRILQDEIYLWRYINCILCFGLFVVSYLYINLERRFNLIYFMMFSTVTHDVGQALSESTESDGSSDDESEELEPLLESESESIVDVESTDELTDDAEVISDTIKT